MSFSEQEVRTAVMTYHEGCPQGKIEFLREAFGIDADSSRTFKVTVEITVPTYDGSGEEIDANRAGEMVVDATNADGHGHLDVGYTDVEATMLSVTE